MLYMRTHVSLDAFSLDVPFGAPRWAIPTTRSSGALTPPAAPVHTPPADPDAAAMAKAEANFRQQQPQMLCHNDLLLGGSCQNRTVPHRLGFGRKIGPKFEYYITDKCLKRHFPNTGPVTSNDIRQLSGRGAEFCKQVDLAKLQAIPSVTTAMVDTIRRTAAKSQPTAPPTTPPPPPPVALATPQQLPPAENHARTWAQQRCSGPLDADWLEIYNNFFCNDPRWSDATACYTYFKHLP